MAESEITEPGSDAALTRRDFIRRALLGLAGIVGARILTENIPSQSTENNQGFGKGVYVGRGKLDR